MHSCVFVMTDMVCKHNVSLLHPLSKKGFVILHNVCTDWPGRVNKKNNWLRIKGVTLLYHSKYVCTDYKEFKHQPEARTTRLFLNKILAHNTKLYQSFEK